MPKKKIITIAGIVLLIIVLALVWYILYGGSNSNNSTNTSYAPTKLTNSSKDIATYIQNDSSLSNFYKLFTDANLLDQLKAASSSTATLLVIVPNNTAFKSLPSSFSNVLLTGQNQASAADIAKYHVASVSIDTKNIADGQKIKTLEGQEIIAYLSGGQPEFTDAKGDQANVLKGPIAASNGTIYIVDTVLLPQ